VQVIPVGVQSAGGAQAPPVQVAEQQSAPTMHGAPGGAHGVWQVRPPPGDGRHSPWQQSVAAAQVAPGPRQVSAPKSHRSVAALHTIEQQVVPPPEVQVSPVGRQPGCRSTTHCPRAWSHMFEQQSASTLQSSLTTRHSGPPHAPPVHASEQQSSARVHGAPSPKQ
jgi:hypothetical protein